VRDALEIVRRRLIREDAKGSGIDAWGDLRPRGKGGLRVNYQTRKEQSSTEQRQVQNLERVRNVKARFIKILQKVSNCAGRGGRVPPEGATIARVKV